MADANSAQKCGLPGGGPPTHDFAPRPHKLHTCFFGFLLDNLRVPGGSKECRMCSNDSGTLTGTHCQQKQLHDPCALAHVSFVIRRWTNASRQQASTKPPHIAGTRLSPVAPAFLHHCNIVECRWSEGWEGAGMKMFACNTCFLYRKCPHSRISCGTLRVDDGTAQSGRAIADWVKLELFSPFGCSMKLRVQFASDFHRAGRELS